jgi:hypothetical protein
MDANELTTEKKYLLEKQRTRGLNKPEEIRLVEIVHLLNKGNLVSDKLVIKINKQEGFNQLQIDKYVKAVELTEKVINSERFKERLLKLELTNTNNKTNQEIYDLMMKGAEILEPLEDREVDVFITMYYKNNKTVGYTYPSTKDTWVNSKFFDSYTPADVGCNLIHEWLHKLGFDHTSAREHTSVPYAVGYLVEDCIEEMEKEPDLYNDELPPPIPEEKKPLPNPLPEITSEPNPVSKQKRVCKKLWYTLWTKEVCWYE